MERLQQAAAALALLLLAGLRGAYAFGGGGVLATAVSGADLNAQGQPLLTPSKAMMLGRAVYWEVPSGVAGTVAMFHGCAHDASDFWPRSVACPECDGLPEEVAHAKQALARGYAVLAVDAADAGTRCFGIHADADATASILLHWLRSQGLQSKPLFVMGVSSGAAFALKLPMQLAYVGVRVHGVISEVLGVLPDAWSMEELGAAYPPAAFLSMPRDAKTAARIAQDVALLRRYGVPADVLEVAPRPLAPDFVSNRSEAISPGVSAKVTAALQLIGLVDPASLAVTQDPRYTTLPWRARLAAMVPELSAAANDSLAADASAVSELLNLAYGNHEIVSDAFTACLAWLEACGTYPLAGLAAQFASLDLPGPRTRDLRARRLHTLPMRPRTLSAAQAAARS